MFEFMVRIDIQTCVISPVRGLKKEMKGFGDALPVGGGVNWKLLERM